MKNSIHKLILFILCLFAFLQCSLEDIEYPGKAITANTFRTENDAYIVYNGILAANQDKYRDAWISVMIGMSDMFSGWRANIATMLTKTNISTNTGQIETVWQNNYKCIESANFMLEEMNNVEMTPEIKEMFEGQCQFIRAWSYLDLVRLFGRVPLKMTQTSSDGELNSPRADVDEVYSLIFTDLESAYGKLPSIVELREISQQIDDANNIRDYVEMSYASKDVALGAHALAALNYANYLDLSGRSDEAKKYYNEALVKATNVINNADYSLYRGPFGDIYNYAKRKETQSEIMFRASYIGDDLRRGFIWSTVFMPNTIMPEIGYGVSQAKIMPWFVEQFSSDSRMYDPSMDSDNPYHCDPRFSAVFLTKWYAYRPTSPAQHGKLCICFPEKGGKAANYFSGVEEPCIIDPHASQITGFPHIGLYNDPLKNGGDQESMQNADFPLLRISEMYLIQAEAMNELGTYTKDQIFAPLNVLRTRARNTVSGGRFPEDINDDYLTDYMNNIPPFGIAESSGSSVIPETDEKYAIRRLILKERDIELCGEIRRYYDIKRMQAKDKGGKKRTMLEYIFGEYIPSLPAGAFGTTFAGCVGTDGMASWSEVRYDHRNVLIDIKDGVPTLKLSNPEEVRKYNYLPIPFSEIQFNPAVANDQNYGW